jgi:hypothetical protein
LTLTILILRGQSFLYTALTIKTSKDYLKNAKIIARMINESPEDARATWFFTPKATPDRELLDMLNKERHEIALHIANKPYEEMQLLEKLLLEENCDITLLTALPSCWRG